MNRKEKREYEKEKKDKRSLLTKVHVPIPTHLKTPTMKDEDNPIVLPIQYNYYSVDDGEWHRHENVSANDMPYYAMGMSNNIARRIRGGVPDYYSIDDIDWMQQYENESHTLSPSTEMERVDRDMRRTLNNIVAPFMTLQEARSAAGLEPLNFELHGNILTGTPNRGPDLYDHLYGLNYDIYLDPINSERQRYYQEVASYFGLPLNWIQNDQIIYDTTLIDVDVDKIKACVRYRLSLELIKLAVNSPLSAKWWKLKYNHSICSTCKSYEVENETSHCITCHAFHPTLISHYKPKESYCQFCADELNRIKMGVTPCPLDKPEGLLL